MWTIIRESIDHWSLINQQRKHTSVDNLCKHVNEHEEDVMIAMTTEEIKQFDFDRYVREYYLIDQLLIDDWLLIDIDNFKLLAYESATDTSKKDTEKTDASAFSVSVLEKVLQKKKILSKVLRKKDDSISYWSWIDCELIAYQSQINKTITRIKLRVKNSTKCVECQTAKIDEILMKNW